MMNHRIRLASPADAEALRRLNNAFNGDTGVTADEIRRSLLTSPEIVVIAEAYGAPAGFCCAQVHHSFCYTAPVAEVTEMYVDEPFRHAGCASGMLRFLEEHLARAYGVNEIHLLTGPGNSIARVAYERAGFTNKNEIYMTKEVCANR